MKPKHPRDWLLLAGLLLGLLLLLTPAQAREDVTTHRAMVVTATAYNSVAEQTDDDPDVAAWGDRLKPGMKSIAVSRDLLDKMNERWENRIDIYMGKDTKAARYFGKRKVRIYWTGV